MATTAELLDVLQEQFKGWNVDGTRGLIHYLDVAHRLLLSAEAEQRVFIDETNGRLPFLTTVEGTFDYALPDNCWKLAAVYVEAGTNSSVLNRFRYLDYGWWRRQSLPLEYEVFGGISFLKIPYIRSWPWNETQNARLAWLADPGDSTDVYSLKYYLLPTPIISDSIQIQIEPPWDEMFLLPATCKLVEGIQHGNYLEARAEVMSVIRPAYWAEQNSGEQGFDYEAESRGF